MTQSGHSFGSDRARSVSSIGNHQLQERFKDQRGSRLPTEVGDTQVRPRLSQAAINDFTAMTNGHSMKQTPLFSEARSRMSRPMSEFGSRHRSTQRPERRFANIREMIKARMGGEEDSLQDEYSQVARNKSAFITAEKGSQL